MNLLIAAGALLAYCGLAANSVALDRHYADIHGRGKEPDARTRLRYRALGWLGIALSLAACVGANGWHTGPVLWCGVLTASAIVLTLLLQYAPHRVLSLAWINALGGLLMGLLRLFLG
ncbi:DUF3325 domain-containing protein [Massilia sp.]|uniref:DUF3325 domain-containing protein n=1 Tax=Massilia sp. TaxID=1882437 RepID=UPI0028AFC078|nr:DUF3325 domain-containing protein [Massilia sp.]